jgi:hypothetical protein
MSDDKLYCSRFSRRKKDAVRICSRLKALGATRLEIVGKRGEWRVRGRILVAAFARFCADECAIGNR